MPAHFSHIRAQGEIQYDRAILTPCGGEQVIQTKPCAPDVCRGVGRKNKYFCQSFPAVTAQWDTCCLQAA